MSLQGYERDDQEAEREHNRAIREQEEHEAPFDNGDRRGMRVLRAAVEGMSASETRRGVDGDALALAIMMLDGHTRAAKDDGLRAAKAWMASGKVLA